jgi:hypothetical protein
MSLEAILLCIVIALLFLNAFLVFITSVVIDNWRDEWRLRSAASASRDEKLLGYLKTISIEIEGRGRPSAYDY